MYNLVYAIAYNEVHHDFKNDTLITSALAYFKNNEDDYNYCRALLFKGITLLNRSKSDQAAVSFLKQAQDIQESEKFSDTLLQFNLNLYMGKALRYRSEYAKAEIHYSKAFDIATKSGKVSDQLIVRLELFWT
jgi:tetratricopeptide (TPR) repeat protein